MYSISDAVVVLGICRTNLYQEIKDGNIRAKRYGQRTLIPESEIERWISNLPEHTEQEEK